MNLANDVGARQDEQVVVPPQVARMLAKPLTAEVSLRQLVPLDHGPHRAVEDEDTFLEKLVQLLDRRHAYRLDLGCGIWGLGFAAAVLTPIAMNTANGSPVLLAPTWTRTSVNPAPRSIESSSVLEYPKWRSPNRYWTLVSSCSL